jgi:hypothetical protein
VQCRRGRLDAILVQHQIQAASITFSMGESRWRSVGLRDGEERADGVDGVDYLRHGTSLPPYVNNLHANMHVSRGSQE